MTTTSSTHDIITTTSSIENVPDLRFRDALNGLIEQFEKEQQTGLLQAAGLMADACEQDRLIYLFGGGKLVTTLMLTTDEVAIIPWASVATALSA